MVFEDKIHSLYFLQNKQYGNNANITMMESNYLLHEQVANMLFRYKRL